MDTQVDIQQVRVTIEYLLNGVVTCSASDTKEIEMETDTTLGETLAHASAMFLGGHDAPFPNHLTEAFIDTLREVPYGEGLSPLFAAIGRAHAEWSGEGKFEKCLRLQIDIEKLFGDEEQKPWKFSDLRKSCPSIVLSSPPASRKKKKEDPADGSAH